MPPDESAGGPNVFQKVAKWVQEQIEWAEANLSDPELSSQIRADLGLDADAPAPAARSDAERDQARATIDAFVARQDVDEQALAATIAQVVALVDTGITFGQAVAEGGVDPWDVFWLLFEVWAADSLRARNPSAYAICVVAGIITEDEEALDQLDLAPIGRWITGDVSGDTAEVIDRLSFLGGTTVVALDALVGAVGGFIDAAYGWDPEPGTDPDSALVAARTLTVRFRIPGSPVHPLLTLVGVPAAHGGSGIVLSLGGVLELSHTEGHTHYTLTAGAHGAFTLYLGAGGPQVFGDVNPGIALRAAPAPDSAGRPAVVLGTSDATRLEIGSIPWGLEIGRDHAGLRIGVNRGKLVIALSQGDGFLANLPGGTVEVPFDVGLIADTANGVRFEGGTGLKVNLPVAATLLGFFTVQYVQLELAVGPRVVLELRGGFAVALGPFQASVDEIGMGADFTALAESGDMGKLVEFLPPRGIGLRLDAGAVKGGGYLFIDTQRGEYAGALELTLVGVFSVKAIALITTKRPDGSEGWSLLLVIYGQFSVHVAFGIFLTGIGGLIGLHHRVDTDALVAGMKTGALDDVLFPENPVADAPRIINRYRTLFPIEPDGLVLGPMLELAFSQPPVVFARLGLLFEVRNALGGGPLALTQVVLVGQLVAQLPPKATGAPAILKLLVDVVGFYDAEEQFLLIRARLRDSFVGIEGFAKLDLTGELLLAMHFGADPTFVLSAGGFHPAFVDVPPRVPATLDRLAVSFAIGPVKLKCEEYFAVTSNSVQAGFKVLLTAKLGPVSIEGWLGFDAIVYLTPRFAFIVGLDFMVAVKAFGATLLGVAVKMDLHGPGEWRAVGYFQIEILFWKEKIDFDERWGSAPEVDAGTASASEALMSELRDPQRLLPEPPVGGASLVTLCSVEPDVGPLAHPLGQLTLRQKAVPLDVEIDRMGVVRLTEGRARFSIAEVRVGDEPTSAREPVLDHFARGQYMDLAEEQRIGGKSFERFGSGVSVGTSAYRVHAAGGRVVAAVYEEKLLEPEPEVARWPWRLTLVDRAAALDDAMLGLHVAFGAAARSERATTAALLAGGPGAVVVTRDLPIVLVDAGHLEVTAELAPALAGSAAVAEQQAAASGALTVEAFELQGV